MRCYTFLYIRKSSEEDDRQSLSLDAQEKECRDYATRHGIAISELIREAHSARKPGRPLFQAMLTQAEALRAGGSVVRILCHKPDRLLRNLADWAHINDLTEAGVELIFVTGSYPNNAQGKMAFGINVVFAKYYVDNLSEEVKKGLREKLSRGEWPALAPLGYQNADKKIAIDLVTAPLVRRAFEYYATGEYSLTSLADQLYREGLGGPRHNRPLAKSVLRDRVLTNPFYCGLLRYNGDLHPGCHEALISSALFHRVQQVLQGKGRPRRIRHHFRYSGLLRCGCCGAAVVGDIKKGRYVYYRCSHRRTPCHEGYIPEAVLGTALRERAVCQLTLREEVTQALRIAADELISQQEPGKAAGQPASERQLEVIEHKLEALLDLRLAGHIDDQRYIAKRNDLVREQAALRERLTTFELTALDPHATLTWFIQTCNDLGSVLERGTDVQIRTLLRTVGSNYQLKGRCVDFEPVEPFTLATQVQSRSQWCPDANDVRNLLVSITAVQQQWAAWLAAPSTDPDTP